ncbi:MAG: 50S ribosomal protein L18 [Candidatus Taylorbacteria bacterium]|nr:50S ribosomal protein L18 [Candidatus Taylorbacteria bacterium]
MKKSIISTTRDRRRKRIRAKVSGTEDRPRLSVYKSNAYMYAQVIDDTKGLTIVSASSMNVKGNKTEAAAKVGTELAKLAKAKGVTKVVFDRGGFIYTGRVKALADAAREGGLEF